MTQIEAESLLSLIRLNHSDEFARTYQLKGCGQWVVRVKLGDYFCWNMQDWLKWQEQQTERYQPKATATPVA
jgi:hypothetical protein